MKVLDRAAPRTLTGVAVLLIGVITACVLESPTAAGGDSNGISFVLVGDSVIVLGELTAWDIQVGDDARGPSQVRWSSADTTVATVDAEGAVRGVGVGRVDITASLTAPDIVGEVSRSKPVDVIYAGITIDPPDSLTGLGEERQLVARGVDVDGNPDEAVPAVFSTLDTAVVTISDSGVVVARANGTATVNAAYQELVASESVTVRQVAKAVRFTVPELALPLLDRDTLVEVDVVDTENSAIASPLIVWSSSDPAAVTVNDDGVIRAVAVSSAVITARVDTASADLMVRVPQGISFLERVAGDGQSGAVGTMVPVTPTVTARNAMGEALSGVAVTFSVSSGGGSIVDSLHVTDVSGTATLGSWMLGTVSGPNTVTASAGEVQTVFTVTATAGPPSAENSLVGVSSDTVAAGDVVVLTLEARDTYGNHLTTGGNAVTFAAEGGTSTGSIGATRDEGDGTYTADFTGATAGTATTIRATIDGATVVTAPPSVVVVAGPPSQLTPLAGDNQTAVVGTPVPVSPSVVVRDAFDNSVAGVTVTFAVVGGGGEVTGPTVVSDAAGVAAASIWTVGSVAGPNALLATADNASVTLSATAIIPAITDTVTLGNLLLGLEPHAVTVDQARGRAYVANRSSDYVTIIDTAGDSALASVVVGGAPVGVAVHSGTGLVYVASEGTNTLSVVDPVALGVDAAIPLGEMPAGVAVNAATDRVLVALPNSDQVAVIDATTNTVETTIGVGDSPQWLAVDGPNNLVFVSNSGDGTVTVVDMSGPTVLGAPVVGTSPQGIAVDESRSLAHVATAEGIVTLSGATIDGTISLPAADYQGLAVRESPRRLYVANATAGELVIVSLTSMNVAATLEMGATARGVALHDALSKVFVTNPTQNTVPIVNISGNSLAGTVERVSDPRGVAVHAGLNRVYVANRGTDNVTVVDGTTHAKLGAAIAVGRAPWGAAVNAETNRLYVTNSGDGSLSAVDLTNDAVIATPAVGTAPRGVAVNASTNRVYVANFGSNTVSVLEGETNAVVATVSVGTEPTDVAVDEATNRIFVTHEGDDLWIIDGASNLVIGSVGSLGGMPSAAVFDPRTASVFAPNGDDPGAVWVIDVVDENVTGSIDLAGQPLSAALLAGGTVIVPTSTAIHYLNTLNGTVAYSMFTGTMSYGIAVNPSSNEAFVADARSNVNGIIVVQH